MKGRRDRQIEQPVGAVGPLQRIEFAAQFLVGARVRQIPVNVVQARRKRIPLLAGDHQLANLPHALPHQLAVAVVIQIHPREAHDVEIAVEAVFSAQVA